MWNERFGSMPDAYGLAPNAWLAANEPRLPRRADVLCLAEGQGRNALWLAQRGHRVTAVDISTVALAQIQARATRLGVAVNTIHADLAHWTPPAASCDAVVLIYAHFQPDTRRVVHARAAAALRPGGVVVLEAFSPAQRRLGLTSGGPRDEAMLYAAAEMRIDFAALDLEIVEELATTLDEGPLHQGEARVVRLRARQTPIK
jgi:SAM-dependent methyltransferase